MTLDEMRYELRERFERLKGDNPSPHISQSLREQMTRGNLIKRIDLWNFIQDHKGKTRDEFGGWLVSQEVRRTEKMIMAVDLWNEMIEQKFRGEGR